MRDMMKMMQQAKNLQKNMEKVQKELTETEVVGSAGDNVSITMTCANKVVGVKVSPTVVEQQDAEILEDYIQIALEDALNKVKTTAEAEMAKVTGGLNLPGM